MKALAIPEEATTTVRWTKKWLVFNRQLIGDGISVYIDRLEILRTPWFSIMLHKIHRPDQQRELHDHPWSFLSLLLWGSYVEDTPGGPRRVRWWNWKRAEDSHSIREVSRRPVWTLVFTGPKRRLWGFYIPEGWVPWDQYDKLDEA